MGIDPSPLRLPILLILLSHNHINPCEGVMNTYFNDFMAQDRHLGVQSSTQLLLAFGAPAATDQPISTPDNHCARLCFDAGRIALRGIADGLKEHRGWICIEFTPVSLRGSCRQDSRRNQHRSVAPNVSCVAPSPLSFKGGGTAVGTVGGGFVAQWLYNRHRRALAFPVNRLDKRLRPRLLLR